MKKVIIAIIVIALVGLGVYYFINSSNKVVVMIDEVPATDTTVVATSTITIEENKAEVVIGKSVEGRDITAYNFGVGENKILFVGGVHGGYSWNTALLAYELVDYLKANPEVIPANVKVSVLPVLNPDGLNKVVGTTTSNFTSTDVKTSLGVAGFGRFNANEVDLNRNFDCDWQEDGKWQTRTVSGGTSAFSEPESMAIKNYIEKEAPTAVVVWYSAAGGVYSSSCNNGVLPETKAITNVFAKASGYPAFEEFDSYKVTGDIVNWLAKGKIPAISVLLTNHKDVEWTKNKAGVEALLKYYAN